MPALDLILHNIYTHQSTQSIGTPFDTDTIYLTTNYHHTVHYIWPPQSTHGTLYLGVPGATRHTRYTISGSTRGHPPYTVHYIWKYQGPPTTHGTLYLGVPGATHNTRYTISGSTRGHPPHTAWDGPTASQCRVIRLWGANKPRAPSSAAPLLSWAGPRARPPPPPPASLGM